MTLESIFYTIGIVAMVLWIGIAITCLILVYYVRYQIKVFKSSFVAKAAHVFQSKKSGVASAIGLAIAQIVLNRFRKNKGSKTA